jgi:hypothetical protein
VLIPDKENIDTAHFCSSLCFFNYAQMTRSIEFAEEEQDRFETRMKASASKLVPNWPKQPK